MFTDLNCSYAFWKELYGNWQTLWRNLYLPHTYCSGSTQKFEHKTISNMYSLHIDSFHSFHSILTYERSIKFVNIQQESVQLGIFLSSITSPFTSSPLYPLTTYFGQILNISIYITVPLKQYIYSQYEPDN